MPTLIDARMALLRFEEMHRSVQRAVRECEDGQPLEGSEVPADLMAEVVLHDVAWLLAELRKLETFASSRVLRHRNRPGVPVVKLQRHLLQDVTESAGLPPDTAA